MGLRPCAILPLSIHTSGERVRIRDRYKYLEIIINCLKSTYKALTTNRTAPSMRMQAHLPFQDTFYVFDIFHTKGTRQGAQDRQLYIPPFHPFDCTDCTYECEHDVLSFCKYENS